MRAWDAAFEEECVSAVRVVTGAGPDAAAAWRRLLVLIGPRIEGWAARNHHLQRWRLAGEDDVRSVLVAVLSRLSESAHENLHRFLASLPPLEPGAAADDEQRRALSRLDRLQLDASDDEAGEETGDEPDPPPPPGDARTRTPLRGWLLRLVGFVALDHVRDRLGWRRDGQPDKRAIGTDASRLSSAPEPASRPPITDYLTVRRLHEQVAAAVAELPAEMRGALDLWLDDVGFDAIAAQLGLRGADDARKLVRAAQARLRHRFRDQAAALRG